MREISGLRDAAEVHRLVVAGAAAETIGIGAGWALHEDLPLAPDEALCALGRDPLHRLDQPFHSLALDRMRQLVRQIRRLPSTPRREDERESRVVAHLLH